MVPSAEVSYFHESRQFYSTQQTDIYLCIFEIGLTFPPQRPYGINLYASDGTLAFNTDYLPFIRGESQTLWLH